MCNKGGSYVQFQVKHENGTWLVSPSCPLPCMMVKSQKLTRLRVKFARATWRKLRSFKTTYYFTIFLRPFGHAKLWAVNHYLYMNIPFFFFFTNYILPHYNYDKKYEKFCSPRFFARKSWKDFYSLIKLACTLVAT